jgi:hypothetical protein
MTRTTTTKAMLGRYSPAQGLPGPELPREGKRAGGKIEIVHGHEVDPYFAADVGEANPAKSRNLGQRRQRVAINAQTDVLEYEHRRGRVTPPAYATGRYIDAVLEAASGRRSSLEFGERNRATLSPLSLQHAMAARIDAAKQSGRLKDAMAGEIGAEAARVVVKVIGEGLSFRMIARIDAMASGKNREGARAAKKGRDCDRAARRIGGLFRAALEDLALAWERKGRPV